MKKAAIRSRRDSGEVLAEMGARFVKAWTSWKGAGDVLTFESPAALFRALTPKRWELIERDVKRVHQDVVALTKLGLITRAEDGRVCVPYDVSHADFDLCSVA